MCPLGGECCSNVKSVIPGHMLCKLSSWALVKLLSGECYGAPLIKNQHWFGKCTQQTHYAQMTSLLRQNDVILTWRRYNDVTIPSCVQWVAYPIANNPESTSIRYWSDANVNLCLSQCWPRFMSPHGISSPPWSKTNRTILLSTMIPLLSYFLLRLVYIENQNSVSATRQGKTREFMPKGFSLSTINFFLPMYTKVTQYSKHHAKSVTLHGKMFILINFALGVV